MSLYASNRASAQLSDNPSKEEIERYVEMLKSYIVIGAAAATDVKEAKMGHTRSVAVAISITEEAKSKGFSCYLSTWHMSGRMIRYKWSVDPLKMGMGFEVRGVVSTELKTTKTISNDAGVVIDTIEEWVAAEKSSQDANSFGDLSILSESIHQTVRTDSIKMRKSTYSGGLLHYPQRMSLKSGLYAAIDGLSPDKVEKVEIQKHPGYDGNNFPPSKPNEFRCLLGTQRG